LKENNMLALFRCTLIVPALLVALLLTAGQAFAIVPQVKDDGKFFSADAVRKANEVIRELQHTHRVDLVIETMDKAPAGIEGKSSSERNRLFGEWALRRFKELGIDGIYLLITRSPGHLQIEVGNDTQRRAFTLADRDKLRELLVRKFREKEYDAGLLEAVADVRNTVDSHMSRSARSAPAANAPPVHHNPAGQAPAGGGSGLMGLICFAVVALLVIWLVVALIRAFTGSMGRGYGGGYGGGGYGPGYGGGGGGGGFMSGLMGGLFGAAAGNFLYDRFFRGDSAGSWGSHAYGGESGPAEMGGPHDTDASGTGADFDDAGGGSGGGDFGGGDFGGGGGGDFGGGDFGGGGGDFGGGGGDF
jgi:uncharacterized protein